MCVITDSKTNYHFLNRKNINKRYSTKVEKPNETVSSTVDKTPKDAVK